MYLQFDNNFFFYLILTFSDSNGQCRRKVSKMFYNGLGFQMQNSKSSANWAISFWEPFSCNQHNQDLILVLVH